MPELTQRSALERNENDIVRAAVLDLVDGVVSLVDAHASGVFRWHTLQMQGPEAHGRRGLHLTDLKPASFKRGLRISMKETN